MVNDHYPVFKWLFHWGYTLFSVIPIWSSGVLIWLLSYLSIFPHKFPEANFGESFRLPSSSTTSIRAEYLASTPECPASGGGWEHLGIKFQIIRNWEHLGILNHFLTTEIWGNHGGLDWNRINRATLWDSLCWSPRVSLSLVHKGQKSSYNDLTATSLES